MPKLIAILERDPARIEIMEAWLNDRFYMYEYSFLKHPSEIYEIVNKRASDLLALCLGCESHDDSGIQPTSVLELISRFLLSQSARFPIIVHSDGNHPLKSVDVHLVQGGWYFVEVEAPQGTDWIGNDWYPALKTALRETARLEDAVH
jgi:hypothetical protein